MEIEITLIDDMGLRSAPARTRISHERLLSAAMVHEKANLHLETAEIRGREMEASRRINALASQVAALEAENQKLRRRRRWWCR